MSSTGLLLQKSNQQNSSESRCHRADQAVQEHKSCCLSALQDAVWSVPAEVEEARTVEAAAAAAKAAEERTLNVRTMHMHKPEKGEGGN